MRYEELIVYKLSDDENILFSISEIAKFLDGSDTEIANEGEAKAVLHQAMLDLIELASSFGYSGNLWHAYLTHILANNENAYSTACEIRGSVNGSVNDAALHDMVIFKEMFDYDFNELLSRLSAKELSFILDYTGDENTGKVFNKRVRDRIVDLTNKLSNAANADEFKTMVTDFYKDFGVGKFGLHKAFRVEHDENVEIVPITNIAHVYLDDLVGYDIQKAKLIENTEAFLEGKPCNNCLLYGDAGTGKSSSIKGILNKYYDRGLRIIEIYKHQFKDLNAVISEIKNRNYRFIIYMDDLSFEEFEVEYKYLKAVIEGGLEKKPSNVLIYATSNRRHLVKETFSDRNDYDDELHKSDSMQEKISLFARFGVSIYFPSPEKKEFNNIVKELAKRYDLNIEENELVLEANKWELSHGGLSGRTASQFIDYLRGTR
ncbi:MAG: ATP-binding protein [Lachnospiraceae bacterium]|nr:ATP-binding protein [Lachnospiraceae bacterium]